MRYVRIAVECINESIYIKVVLLIPQTGNARNRSPMAVSGNVQGTLGRLGSLDFVGVAVTL